MTLSRIVTLVLILLITIAVAGFARQDVETHSIHIGMNPFTWIFGIYSGEVGIPLTGFIEIAGQFDYLDGRTLIRTFSGGDEPDEGFIFTWVKVGPILRLFPAQNATGFFLSFRAMYMYFRAVDEWDGIDETFHDFVMGTDIGWRYIWEFNNDWGMYLQGYFGIERFLLNYEISDIYMPILFVWGFQIGFHK
jgi:hypothetical protein